MSGLPVLDRFLRVLDSFLLMRLGRPGDAADHKCESAEKQRHSRQFLQHTAYLLLCTLTASDLRDSRARTIFYVPVRHRNTRFFMVSRRSGIAHALIYAGGCSPDSFEFDPLWQVIQLDDIFYRIGILRALVLSQKPLHAREAQCVPDALRIGT